MARYKINKFTGKQDRVGGNSNNSGLPVGTILAFPTTSIPSNFVWADGSLYPTALYPDLFALIGYTYGGSGANFAVPNITDRFLKGDNGTNIATSGGANSLTESQLPIVNASSTISVSQNNADVTANNGHYFANPSEGGGSTTITGFIASGNHTPTVEIDGVNTNFGGGQSHEHPHIVVRYAICYASIGAGVASPTPSLNQVLAVGNTSNISIIIESVAPSRFVGDLQLHSSLRLRGSVNYVDVKADNATTPYTLTVPSNAGNNGEVLITDGTGKTSWSNLNSVSEWIASPTTSTSTGLQGQKAYDATYVYFCVQDNVWVRVSKDLTTW